MKVIKREVKTIDTIEFDAEELLKIVEKGQSCECVKVFGGWSTAINYCKTKMCMFNVFTSEELRYIARYYGYDNWKHCGGYVNKTHKYRMTVYCYGDIDDAE